MLRCNQTWRLPKEGNELLLSKITATCDNNCIWQFKPIFIGRRLVFKVVAAVEADNNFLHFSNGQYIPEVPQCAALV